MDEWEGVETVSVYELRKVLRMNEISKKAIFCNIKYLSYKTNTMLSNQSLERWNL